MNKTYRSIWSEADQTWVAAPETAAARGKSSRRLAVLATGAAGVMAGFAPAASFAATPAPGTVGNGGLELCSGASGYSWGNSGGNEAINCTNASGAVDGLAFSLNNSADNKGGYGFSNSTAQVAGYKNGTLNITGASVMVYGPTTFHNVVTMSNQKIVQLAPGLVSATSTEAVNGSQLYAAMGGATANAVTYDTSAHNAVTLGGVGSTVPVALHNVAPGALTASSYDAVNGAQLYTTNQNVTNLQGKVADAVMYDSSTHNSVTFGGVGSTVPVALHNVAPGKLTASSYDAVNGAQLYATNQSITNMQGTVANAVTYDTSAHDTLTLGGQGSTVPVALHNVKAGDLSPASNDAVNGAQLYTTNQSITNIAGQVADAVMYDSSAHGSVTLGGEGSTVPVALHNVKAGDLSASSNDAVNGSQLYATNQSITNISGQIADAVTYDTSAHDTLTLGGEGSTTPVALHNVKAGDLSPASNDAVNGAQLYTTNQSITNLQGTVADAVLYDTSAHDSVTLGGEGSTATVALHNVKAGDLSASSYDAVNGAQLYATNQSITNLQGTVADAVVYDTSAHDSLTLGGEGSTTPVALHNVKAGDLSASSSDAVNGAQLYATNQSIDDVINDGTKYFHANSTGGDSVAAGADAIAVGQLASASGDQSAAIGVNAVSNGNRSTAIGANAVASNANDVALGAGSTTAAVVGTTGTTIAGQGYTFAGATPTSTVSVGAVGSERTITNVAAGQLTAQSTDAVNGSQLYATNLAVSSIQGASDNAVLYDTSVHDTLTLGGVGSTVPVSLHNVANGEISADSSDAVNGSQLYNVSQSVTNISGDLTKIHNTLTTAGWGAQAPSADPTVHQMGGFIMDANGGVSNPAVLYVPNTIGTASSQIVLDPGQGNSNYFVNGNRQLAVLPAGTLISNVADGIQATDAANVGQVYKIVAATSGGGGSGIGPVQLKAVGPTSSPTGVNSAGLDTYYNYANYYTQVRGLGDSAGQNGPSDAAQALGSGAIAMGSNALVDQGASAGVAIGAQAHVTANDGVALGSGSVANEANTVSVGNDGTTSYTAYDSNGQAYTVQNPANTRRIVNMAAGQDDTDAVNVSQLKGTLAAIGGGAGVNPDGSIIAPTFSVGGTTVNTVSAAITNLDTRVTENTAAIAALGGGNGGPATPVSASSRSMLAAAAPVGAANVSDSASTTDADALHYDSSAHDTVTLSSTSGGTVQLSGLQSGSLSASSTDAVTGQQLFATNQQLDTLNQTVQNINTTGSTAIATNTTSGPAAASGTQSVAVGGGAVTTGNNATAIGDKANASADNSVAIGANSIANRANAVSVGAEGSERQIVNVAAGTSGTDAVNLDQMNNALAQQSNAFGQQISGLQNSINTVSKNAYAGVAAAMAMPNLTPSGPGRTVVAAGGGYYMGGSAGAVGVTYRSQNMRWLMNGAVSVTSTGTAGVRAQVGYEF